MTENNKQQETIEQKIKTAEEQFKDDLKKFHQASNRHVLVLEAILSNQDKVQIFGIADAERRLSNELTAIMNKKLEQLFQTKRYRKLLKLYNKYKVANDKGNKNNIAKQLNEMQKEYNLTWDFCRKEAAKRRTKYNLHSTLATTVAENLWQGVKKCLFGNGKKLHFKSCGDLPEIRAKEICRCVPISVGDNTIQFKLGKIKIPVEIKDRFQNDEIDAILHYLAHSDEIDREAVEVYNKDKTLTDTYRPCYATLVCQVIRGKLRVYVHLTIEGVAKPKYRKDGSKRHKLGKGRSCTDLGTQSFAYTAKQEVGLKNLAERGSSITKIEAKEVKLLQRMDRSRRANNPDNYNEDGTIKKGKQVWKNSNRYKNDAKQLKELRRVAAINRHLAIREDVWQLRSMSDIAIIEKNNVEEWKERTEEIVVNENNEKIIQHKKNHGHAVQTRCPGYFQQTVKEVFEHTGGQYIELPYDYRASQYDHTVDEYIKKELSDRMYELSDGTEVQRDWYSSFLGYCADLSDLNHIAIDKEMCKKEFASFYQKALLMIQEIKDKKLNIMNSGIAI